MCPVAAVRRLPYAPRCVEEQTADLAGANCCPLLRLAIVCEAISPD